MSDLVQRWPDLLAISVYLTTMAGLAFYFAGRNTSTEEYFVGNRGFSGWVIGLSMLGTIVSSATFLALPAAAYVLDWRQLAVNFALPIVAVLAVLVFIPLYRQRRITTAFEYLGMRYGSIPRVYGTISFVIMQLIRSAQVLFLLALPVRFLIDVPLPMIIVSVGLFVALYTIVGGIDTVIWTDVIQTMVLVVGGLICAITIVCKLPNGVSSIIEVGLANDKFSFGSFDWDLSQRTFWTVAILGAVNWLAIYGGDQNIVQRYLAARSIREARKATIIYSVLALPMWAFFYFIGTSVFVFYQEFPNKLTEGLQADEVLPHFILQNVSVGIAGVIIAAIFAAAMSTLDSSLNAIATVTVIDVLKPWLAKDRSDQFYLIAARVVSGAAAVLMIIGGLIFSQLPKESMNDVSLMVTSIFGGCLMGLFLLGFFTRCVDEFAASWALAAAVVFNLYLGLGAMHVIPSNWQLPIHSYWTGALVNLAFIAMAFVIAWIRGSNPRDLTGLTVWTTTFRTTEET